MFTSTSTASFGSYEGNVYETLREKFQKNSAIKNIFDKLSQVVSDQKDSMSVDTDDDDDDDDGNDGEYDDGEHDDDPDDQKEGGLLPKMWVLDGEKTPHEGNYTDEGDDENITNTIDHPGGDGVVVWGNGTVNPDGNVNATNGITIGEGEWTVEHDGEGGTLERFVKIVTERNVKLGALLQRVIERTVSTDGNGFFSESTWIAGEGTKADGVVEGGSVGTPGVDNDDVVVLTDDG